MDFKKPIPIMPFEGTKDFSNLSYKDDSKYKPVIAVKSKDSNPRIILQTNTNYYKEIVDFLVAIGEPIVRTKNFHEYELNKFSLYSASCMGLETSDIIQILENISKNVLQKDLKEFIEDNTKTYGMARIMLKNKRYFIVCKNQEVFKKISDIQEVRISHENIIHKKNKKPQTEQMVIEGLKNDIEENIPEEPIPENYIEIDPEDFGTVKEACEKRKYFLLEEFSFREEEEKDKGKILNISIRFKSPVRAYQEKALNIMCSNGVARSGIIVLPCGAGKTLVGILAICTIKRNTIIICNNNVSVSQWEREIKEWVNISKNDNKGKNNDDKKNIINNANNENICKFTSKYRDPLWNFDKEAGILITSYSMLSYTGNRSKEVQESIDRMKKVDWGLMIIDEVQLLPANTFMNIIKKQYKAHCKLGLTATLVREDRGIENLHLMLGPKLYEANWLDLQKDGFLARVKCIEIWSEMHPDFYEEYLKIDNSEYKKELYVSNPNKYLITLLLLEKHKGDKIIIFSDNLFTIKQYDLFLKMKKITFRMIHGDINDKQREIFLKEFKEGSGMNILLMTKVGDISIDIPNANVIIQVSSHYGSRMQEAQRFGRILRPKKDIFSEFNAFFYTIVTKNTEEMKYSNKRHRFLVDQGYYFNIINDIKQLIENKTEEEKNEILKKFEKDVSYEGYVNDTKEKVFSKIRNNEKFEFDYNDQKDSDKILAEEENLQTNYE